MKQLTILITLLTCIFAHAGTITLEAPAHAGKLAVIHVYDDLFSLRPERIAAGMVGADGSATLDLPEITGTKKALLQLGEVGTEFFIRNGTSYVMRIPPMPRDQVRSLAGTARVDAEFIGMDRMDINALISDLNMRLDAFIAKDLATDEVAGMQAAAIQRKDGVRDSIDRPSTLFYTPSWSEQRLDSFEVKLRKFYADVKDPWFLRSLDMGLAGLRIGPKSNDMATYKRYFEGRPPAYDVPEYVRTFRSFFQDHLMVHVFRSKENELIHFVKNAGPLDSLKALLKEHDALRNDPQLLELVLIDRLYLAHPGRILDRKGIERILTEFAGSSVYPEHRKIATNMLWDLTAMRVGTMLPALELYNANGEKVDLDTLFTKTTCLAITAPWCTYCEAEVNALAQLGQSYPGMLRQVIVMLDAEPGSLATLNAEDDGRIWLSTSDPEALKENLRCRSIPTFYLLNGRSLAHSPAPLPSTGMAAILHRMQAERNEEDKIKFGSDGPPKR